MSGVLHPVGPESARTYWVRRGILLAVVLLLALGVVLAVASLTKAAVVSSPPPSVLPAGGPTPSASTTPAAGSLPTSSSPAPAASSSPSSSLPSSSLSTSTAPGSSSTSTSSTSAAARPSATASAAQPEPTTTTVGTPDCRPADLRVTLKGDKSLAAGKANAFRLSLINGGAQTCLVSVTDRNFELKIYSGKDRIWSSKDCSKVLADFDKKLASQADVGWTMTWNGRRSVKGETCDFASERPQSGIYWATAQLTGADPVQLRMTLS